MTLREALHALFSHRRTLWLVPAIALVAALAYSLIGTRHYETSARLLVLSGEHESTLDSDHSPTDHRPTSGRGALNEVELLAIWELPESELSSLISAVREQRAADRFASLRDRVFGELEQAEIVAALSDSAHFEAVPGTDIVTARFRWADAGLSLAIAEAYLDSYLAQRSGVVVDGSSQPRAGEARPERKWATSDLALRIEVVQAALATLAVKEDHLSRQLNDPAAWVETPDLGTGTSDLTRLDQLYFELLSERDRLSQLYQSDARMVVALDRRIASLRQQKADSVRAILGLRNAALSDELARLIAKRDGERSDAALMNLAEVAADGRTALPGIVMIAEPTLPEHRFAGFDRRLLVYALLLGLGVAMALALILDRFDPKVHRARDLEEAVGIPVLATIPTRKVVHHGSSRAR